MAMLLFYSGETRFAIACSSILRIVPYVFLKKIPFTSPAFLGLLTLGGTPLPILDFCQIIEKRSASLHLDTRMILLNFPEKPMGILVEKVHQMIELDEGEFTEDPYLKESIPFVDRAYVDQSGVIYLISLDLFLPFVTQTIFHEAH